MVTICPNCGSEQNNDSARYCASCGSAISPQVAGGNMAPDSIPAGAGNKCDYCAKAVPYSEYFRCKYCSGQFCYDHRLPENHLCKSTSQRRIIPTGGTSSSSYGSYSYSAPYYTQKPRSSPTFGFNISRQGRNLAITIVLGLVVGSALSVIAVNGNPLVLFFLQNNTDVLFRGAYWQLVTSIIIAPLSYSGFVDVGFNALAIVWLDRLFSTTYNAKQYYLVFLVTGILGNVISLLNGPFYSSFGASGGIFGLIAGAVSADYVVNRRFNMSLVGWFVFVFLISSFTGSYIDWLAHLGGAVFGLVAGVFIGRVRKAYRG